MRHIRAQNGHYRTGDHCGIHGASSSQRIIHGHSAAEKEFWAHSVRGLTTHAEGAQQELSFDEWNLQCATKTVTITLSRSSRCSPSPQSSPGRSPRNRGRSRGASVQTDSAASTKPCSARWTKSAWLEWLPC